MTAVEVIGVLVSAFAIGYTCGAIFKYFKKALEQV